MNALTGRVDNISVAKACRLFGFSREYFYKLERSFMARGFVALLGSQKGRRPLIALNNGCTEKFKLCACRQRVQAKSGSQN